jgi:hypothetical protein
MRLETTMGIASGEVPALGPERDVQITSNQPSLVSMHLRPEGPPATPGLVTVGVTVG